MIREVCVMCPVASYIRLTSPHRAQTELSSPALEHRALSRHSLTLRAKTLASQNVYMHRPVGKTGLNKSTRTNKQMLLELYDDGSTARVQMVCFHPQGAWRIDMPHAHIKCGSTVCLVPSGSRSIGHSEWCGRALMTAGGPGGFADDDERYRCLTAEELVTTGQPRQAENLLGHLRVPHVQDV